MGKKIRGLLLILFAATFLFSAWKVFGIVRSYQASKASYNTLSQYVAFEKSPYTYFENEAFQNEQPEAADDAAVLETEPVELPDLSAWPQVDFEKLAQINPDIVGWIYIEGTEINYPVVQGADNAHYLNYLFDGTPNKAGSIFLDYRCTADFSDRHSIIYGHHMRDKSMFAGLMSYKDQAFYDEHPVALLTTPTAYYKIQFFSGQISHNRGNAWKLALDDAEHAAWLQDIQEKSCFETDVAPTIEDRIVSLSTCTNEFTSAKFVLHGYISEAYENPSLYH